MTRVVKLSSTPSENYGGAPKTWGPAAPWNINGFTRELAADLVSKALKMFWKQRELARIMGCGEKAVGIYANCPASIPKYAGQRLLDYKGIIKTKFAQHERNIRLAVVAKMNRSNS